MLRVNNKRTGHEKSRYKLSSPARKKAEKRVMYIADFKANL